MSCITVITLTLNACGGGSSGTGENERIGRVVDQACRPVASLDMAEVGIEATDDLSAEDGSFELAPSVSRTIQVPFEAGGREIDVSGPTCILMVYDRGTVISVNSYPLMDLPECSIDGVRGIVGRYQLPKCTE
jgi:hypothetical protein